MEQVCNWMFCIPMYDLQIEADGACNGQFSSPHILVRSTIGSRSLAPPRATSHWVIWEWPLQQGNKRQKFGDAPMSVSEQGPDHTLQNPRTKIVKDFTSSDEPIRHLESGTSSRNLCHC
eukprot:922401-Amphidinium_carterae.1